MKKQQVFEGVGTALVTPFRGGKPDLASLSALIERQISGGADALIVCATTGENATLSDAEHRELISFCIKESAGRLPVIAGTGSNDTAHACEMSAYAAKEGADAVLAVTPYYNKANQEGLYLSYKAIAEAAEIPVILYNVPSRTCVDIAPETAARLSEIPNIAALKEASSDLTKAAETVRLCAGKLSLLCGSDDLFLPMLSLGAAGIISVSANLFPRAVKEIYLSWVGGDTEKARRLFLKLQPLNRALFREISPSPVKYALCRLGLCTDEVRLPLCHVTLETEKIIDALLPEYTE